MKEVHDPEHEEETSPEMSSREWLTLSLWSAVIYTGAAWLIFYFFREGGIGNAFGHGLGVLPQLGVGLAAGLAFAYAVNVIIKHPPVEGVLDDFFILKLISQTRLSLFDRSQISFFAGTGEELLFRGALQPLLGIWVTSIIFVALHGYFKFGSLGHILYGLMMFGLSMGLGYLFETAGLLSAMVAHAVYDLVMLGIVQHDPPSALEA